MLGQLTLKNNNWKIELNDDINYTNTNCKNAAKKIMRKMLFLNSTSTQNIKACLALTLVFVKNRTFLYEKAFYLLMVTLKLVELIQKSQPKCFSISVPRQRRSGFNECKEDQEAAK